MEFVSSLVRSLAWPAVLALSVVLLRKQLRQAVTEIARRLESVKAGGVEVQLGKWQARAEKTAQVIHPDGLAVAVSPGTPEVVPPPIFASGEIGAPNIVVRPETARGKRKAQDPVIIVRPETARGEARAHDARVITWSLDDVWPLVVSDPLLAVVRSHEILMRVVNSMGTLADADAEAVRDLTALRDEALPIGAHFTSEMASTYVGFVRDLLTKLASQQPG